MASIGPSWPFTSCSFLAIGVILREAFARAADFFPIRPLDFPRGFAGLAFVSANLGAQEVIGMAASGAKYGMMTSHFYWLGAIPAMVFPRRVHDAVLLRLPRPIGARVSAAAGLTRKREASTPARSSLWTVISSGDLDVCMGLCAGVVLAYIFFWAASPPPSTTKLLQFFLIVFGFLPLVLLGAA